jgi:hypothetical protein
MNNMAQNEEQEYGAHVGWEEHVAREGQEVYIELGSDEAHIAYEEYREYETHVAEGL